MAPALRLPFQQPRLLSAAPCIFGRFPGFRCSGRYAPRSERVPRELIGPGGERRSYRSPQVRLFSRYRSLVPGPYLSGQIQPTTVSRAMQALQITARNKPGHVGAVGRPARPQPAPGGRVRVCARVCA